MKQLKRIKQKKNFPMRVILSTIGTLHYGISKHLVNITQPTLNKNQYKGRTQHHLFRKLEHGELNQMKYKFHVTNLHPLIPIDKTIDVCLQQLSEDDFKTKTKLTLIDIQQLIKLCVNAVFFRTMLSGIYLTQDQLVFQ